VYKPTDILMNQYMHPRAFRLEESEVKSVGTKVKGHSTSQSAQMLLTTNIVQVACMGFEHVAELALHHSAVNLELPYQ